MTLKVFAGVFEKRSGTGTQAITGFGFLPKGVKITMVENTASGQKTDINYSIGFGTSSTNRGCLIHTKHQGTDLGGERHSNTSIMGIISNTGTIEEEADLDSMDSDGITLDWTTSTTTLMKFKVEAWGGTDVTNITVFEFGLSATTGNHSETGMGFQPDFGMIVTDGNVLANAFANKIIFAYGVGKSASDRWNLSGSNKNKITKTLQGGGALHSNGMFSVRKKTAQYDSEAELVSYDTDGLTYNTSDAPMNAGGIVCGLYMKLTTPADVQLGTFNKSTSGAPTDDAITSIGCDPTMVSFVTAGGEAVNTARSNEYHAAYGCAFDTLETYSSSDMRENATDDPVVDSSLWSETKVIGLHTNASNATIDSEADFKSFDTGGFTITWTTNDSNAWGVGWVAWEGFSAILVGRTWDIRHDISDFVNQTFNIRHDIAELIGRTWNIRHDIAAFVFVPAESRDKNDIIVGSVGVVLFKKTGSFPYTYTQTDSATTDGTLGTHNFVVEVDGSVYVIFYLKELSPDEWDMSGEFIAS